jgi:D-alanine-D-alanine ligase
LRIALLFNARPVAAAPEPDDAHEEFDSPETVASLAEALADFGDVEPVEADRQLPRRLDEGGFDFAFNIAEGRGRRCREAHAAAVCEMLGIPFTHSDPLTLAITLDKTMARRVVSPDVAVAPALLLDDDWAPPGFSYPVVVKPNDEGSSKGVRDDSVAEDAESAMRLVARLRDSYGCPVLVEQYLPGPEVTVGITGNGRDARILGMMEIAPAAPNGRFLYSVEAKRAFRERVQYFIPPRLPAATLREIEASALAAYRLLGCRDIARLDFRLDGGGRPRFLECNPLPGLSPETADIVILSRQVISHRGLVRGIFLDAARRYGMELR